MQGYDFIYKMKPIKEVEPHWWKLKWTAIKNGTYNLYAFRSNSWNAHLVGFRFYDGGAHNGWGRSWSGFNVEIGLWFCTIYFWIIWNIIVMDDGPQDQEPKKPLNGLSHLTTNAMPVRLAKEFKNRLFAALTQMRGIFYLWFRALRHGVGRCV